MKRYTKLFETFRQEPQGYSFIVGQVIADDGELDQETFTVSNYREALQELMGLISRFRPKFELEKASQDPWRYGNSLFFVGKGPSDMDEPEVEIGSRGEILLDDIEILDKVNFSIYGDPDFDGILLGIMNKLRSLY
jgi:hypothetical protein